MIAEKCKYCTSTTGCTGLLWSVTGGSIVGPTNTNCVTVVWNQPSAWPTSVTLNANCPNTCGNTATLNVPVLYPNLPIQGPLIVCQGSTASYYLPVLPGTFYKWTLSGGGNIIGPDSNTAVININWTGPVNTSHTIICNYHNPYSGCSGADTITVTIRPPFRIMGISPACTTIPYNYVTNGPAATWTFVPPTGFTNTPVGSNQQTVVWSVPGNYSITATPSVATNFCTPSATINIVVNPTPIVNPIVGPNLICPNQLINYSVTSNVPSGSFTWILTGGGTASGYGPNNSSASVNFTGSGPWQLQATQTVNGCTGSFTLPITKVGPPPPITLSPATVCSGGSVTATVTGIAPPGGYTWSATPGAVLTGAQGGVSTTFTVNSNATITVMSCGGSSTINVTVTPATVNINPTPGPCNITLTASPGGGTYAWFLNGNPAGGPAGSVTTNQNGNWVVQATYGGCVATAQYTVTGITPVNAHITAIGSLCNGGSVTLTAGIPANCPTPVFTWSNGFVGNPLITNVAANYFVTVSCSNGCSAVSNTIPVLPCGGGNGNGNGNCINDLVISPSNCNNPVTLTTNIPSGCSSNTMFWDYGDGWSNATGTHLYNNIGTYTVNAVMTCGNGTVHCGTQNITIPMVDSFTSVVTCGINGWNVQLQDASLYLPSYAGYSTVWSATCGSLSNPNIPNPILTVPMGCNPTVTLTISMNGCTLTKSFTFSFPNTVFTINGPSPACQNVINSYSSSYTTGVISYNWTFGDIPPTTGVTNPISHAFTGTPPNPSIGLTIKDQYGCIFSTSITVSVTIPRALNITPGPLIKICPDCAPPVTLTATPLAGWTGYQWYHDGNAIGGANASTYVLCNFDASGNYYVTANDAQNNNCPVTSDTVKVVYNPKPVADIQGQTIWCSATLPGNIFLNNSINDPNTSYVWTATGPGTVTFSPDNLQSYASVTVSAYGTYQFILTATDVNTGCIARDTFCAFLYIAPSAVINGPAGILCEGTPHTFTCVATPPNPNYVYVWSNGVTGPTMTTSAAGTYSVTVTNPTSGCFAQAFGPTVHSRPNVSLFPIGCDTMCLKDTLVPPLPLGPGQVYGTQYTIQWYVDNNLYYTGPFLVLSGLALGPHTVYIVVTTIPWGCTSTSGVFNVFIDPCADCDCKGSKWGDIIMTQGNNPPVKLKCNNPYTLQCNLPYSINASYICKDTTCGKKVTYVLYPPTGSPISGNVPLNFTPVAGVYVLTLYGWCGDKKCDSCTIDLTVKCDCDCKGSKWGPITVAQAENGGDVGKAVIVAPMTVNCGKTYDLPCNKPYTVNASFSCKDSACNGKVTYSLQPPVGLPITGTLPLTFTPNQNGVYVLTLYGWCGTKICDSCVIKFNVKCDPCNCDGSHWGDIILNGGINDGGNHDGDPKNVVGNVVIGNPIALKCKNTYDLVCNKPYTVNAAFICKDTNCNGKVTYSLKPPTGLPVTGTLPLTFTPIQTGVYVLTLYGWCGNKICDSCVIKFNVKCDPCNCDGSHWGDITLDGGELGHGDVPNNPVGVGVAVIGNPGTAVAIKCKNTYDLVCNKPYTVNATFICNDPKCPGKVTYSLQPPIGLPISGTVPLTFTPNQNGVYVLTLYGWCGNKICDSCVIKFNVKCDPCNCAGSHWGDITLNGGDNGGDHGDNPNNPVGNVVIGNPGNTIALVCKKSYTINCNQPYTVNATYICKDPHCNGNVTYKLQPPTGLPITGNLALTFTPTQTGTYTLTLYGWCGNKICDSCVITFKTTCCDCKGSKWAEIFVNDGAKQTFLNCGKTYDWKCKVPFTLNAVYSCAQPNCNGTVGYTFTPAVGSPTSGNLPFTYTPTVSGNYTVELYGKCGGKICDTCKIVFHVDCPKDTNCCKHDIKVQAGNVTYTPNTNSTIAGQTFTINGLSGVNLSEVRAEVLSYDLSSNFNNECLGCKTLPFTWASINSAGNIGVVPPQITLYGTTTAVFSPTGAAVYQNPREVTWNNGSLFTITGPIGINFILPPTPTLDCCELSGRICVKFTFRDENCYECEAIVCFNVKIKK